MRAPGWQFQCGRTDGSKIVKILHVVSVSSTENLYTDFKNGCDYVIYFRALPRILGSMRDAHHGPNQITLETDMNPRSSLRTLLGWLCLFALSLTLGTLFALSL